MIETHPEKRLIGPSKVFYPTQGTVEPLDIARSGRAGYRHVGLINARNRSLLMRRLRKGGRLALLQQHHGGTRCAVGAPGFAATVEGDWGRGGQRIGCRRRHLMRCLWFGSHGHPSHDATFLPSKPVDPTIVRPVTRN